MDTIADRLAATAAATPDPEPVDHRRLARRARARARRRRALAAGAALLVVAALGAGVSQLVASGTGQIATGPTAADGSEPTSDPPAATGSLELSDGFGTWHQLDDAPFGLLTVATTAALSDGRILVWGPAAGDAVSGAATSGWGGGIHDPATDRWELIPDAPFRLDPQYFHVETSVADDRLLAVGKLESGYMGGAVFDVADGSWTELPPQEHIESVDSFLHWDGDTAVLLDLDPGWSYHASPAASDEEAPAIDGPMPLRWTRGDENWIVGAAGPLSRRAVSGIAEVDGSLYVIGGVLPIAGSDAAAEPLADGAAYDVAADQWQELPPLPEPAGSATIVEIDGEVTVVDDDPLPVSEGGPATWSLSGDNWVLGVSLPDRLVDDAAVDALQARDPGIFPDELLSFMGDDPDRARLSLVDVQRDGGLTVATSNLEDPMVVRFGAFPGADDRSKDFTVVASDGQEGWSASAPAPFTNRMGSITALIDGKLYVIGGQPAGEPEPSSASYVLDITG